MSDRENPQQILINRYSSRRLYNTSSSDYVTLDDIAKLIREGNDIKITDKKSGDDITRQILLQIITEHESRGENILPLNILTDIVRSYSDKAQDFVPDFLEQSFQVLKQRQKEILGTLDPAKSFQKLQQWQQDQYGAIDSMMSNWMGNLNPNPEDQEDGSGNKDHQQDKTNDDEVERLKKQFKELQDKIDKL